MHGRSARRAVRCAARAVRCAVRCAVRYVVGLRHATEEREEGIPNPNPNPNPDPDPDPDPNPNPTEEREEGIELHEVLVEELVSGRVDEDVEDDV